MSLSARVETDASLAVMAQACCANDPAAKIRTSVVHALRQARYYDSSRGQFLSEDPSFLAIGTPKLTEILNRVNDKGSQAGQQLNDRQALTILLADPQLMNSYGYGRDNPHVNRDSTGE